MKKAAFLLVFICVLTACNKNFIEEVEPNDRFVEANSIDMEKPIKGYLNTDKDIDIYEIIVTEKKVISLELSPVKGVNHAIAIYKDVGGDRKIIKLIDDVRKSSAENMPNIAMESGRYYIKILHGDRDEKKGNEENPYTLTIKEGELLFEESEGNDDFEAATLLPSAEKYNGYFYPSFNKLNKEDSVEYDFYKIEIIDADSEPSLLDVTLSGVEGIDSIIKVFGPDKELIVETNSVGSGLGESLKDIGLRKSGTYYICVYADNYSANNNQMYSIQANIKPYDSSIEMEPNNTEKTKNILRDNIINGKIFPPGDQDYFIFKPEQNKNVHRLEVIPPDGIDIKADILDGNGKVVMTIDNKPENMTEVIPNYYSEGEFTFKIYSDSSQSNPDMNYAVSINSREKEPEEEVEPNDDVSSAYKVQKNIIKGYISSNNDKDCYLIQTKSRIRVKFAVSGIDGSKIKISVTDSLGYIVKTVDTDSKEVVEFQEMIDGKGYLIVESDGEVSSDPYFIEMGE